MTERFKSPVQHPKQIIPGLILETVARIYIREIKVSGSENLRKIEELIGENIPIVFTSNHRSLVDAIVHYQAQKRSGFKETAKKLAFLAGETQANSITNWLSRGINTIDAQQPTTLKYARRSLEGGYPVVIYPEAGREKNLQGHPIVAIFLNKLQEQIEEEIVIAPMGVIGTQFVLPSGEWRPRWGKCAANFGNPYPLSDLSGQSPKKAVATMMHRIAECLPNNPSIPNVA